MKELALGLDLQDQITIKLKHYKITLVQIGNELKECLRIVESMTAVTPSLVFSYLIERKTIIIFLHKSERKTIKNSFGAAFCNVVFENLRKFQNISAESS